MPQFAIVTSKGEAIVVSSTERGAKNYATRHGYKTICQVSPYSWTCYNLKTKQGKKWLDYQEASVLCG